MSTTPWIPASLWQSSSEGWESNGICAQEVADAYPEDRRYIAGKWWPVHTKQGRTVLTPEVREAVDHCKSDCPVLTECRLAGMAEREGVWGGLLPEERQRLRRRASRQAARQRKQVTA